MSNFFLDCEFTGLVQRTTLISMALYRDDDCYFYAEFTDYNKQLLNPWIEENVLTQLFFNDKGDYCINNTEAVKMKGNTPAILEKLETWLQQFDDIEIWGDVPVYDWMLFCELFGGSLNLPKNIFYIPFDLATLGKIKLNKNDFSRIEFVKDILPLNEQTLQHNSLIDAKAEKLCFEKLTRYV